MNKQEVIEKIKALKGCTTFVPETRWIRRDEVLNIIDQLDEPEKPVVPQFVADWYEDYKGDLEFNIYNLCIEYRDNGQGVNKDLKEWFGNDSRTKPIETLVKMKLYGYEVEKEKLYTVEIPNPNGSGYSKIYLAKNKDSGVELFTWSGYTSIEFADNWKQEENAQLTESEIKKDFDWAWQFKEEVKE